MIKVVALDVYGTILAFDDPDYSFPSRTGLEEFFDECDKRGIRVVTSSDGLTGNVKNDLANAFRRANGLKTVVCRLAKGLTIERFDGFFQMDQGVKDFSVIIGHYGIAPRELLVVGDSLEKDIIGAMHSGAYAVRCPVYGVDQGKGWSFGEIDLDSISGGCSPWA